MDSELLFPCELFNCGASDLARMLKHNEPCPYVTDVPGTIVASQLFEIPIDIQRRINYDYSSPAPQWNRLIISGNHFGASQPPFGVAFGFQHSQCNGGTVVGYFAGSDRIANLEQIRYLLTLNVPINPSRRNQTWAIHNVMGHERMFPCERANCSARFLDYQSLLEHDTLGVCPYIADVSGTIVASQLLEIPKDILRRIRYGSSRPASQWIRLIVPAECFGPWPPFRVAFGFQHSRYTGESVVGYFAGPDIFANLGVHMVLHAYQTWANGAGYRHLRNGMR